MRLSTPTAQDVRARREARGCGMMDAKRELTIAALKKGVLDFRSTGDQELLADILDALVDRMHFL